MREVVFRDLKLTFYLQCQEAYGVSLGMVNNNVYCVLWGGTGVVCGGMRADTSHTVWEGDELSP